MAAASPILAAPAYRRRILLAVAGLSPQVVTETLYALARQGQPQALPTEVHILTTQEGAERARLTLLGQRPGWFARLRRECRLPAMQLTEANLHLARDGRGRPLPDIRTPRENELLADQVTALVRRFTADPDTQLHVSLAGGRKTMGFYAGYALSLYGRPQDRLSHVLVSAPFESHPEFFYPAARRRILYDRDRRPLDAAQAEVTLAEIPFVRMRESMSQPLLRGRAGFSATVAALNQAQAPPRLALQLETRQVRAGNATLRLPPRELALYLWLARRCHAGFPGIACPPAGAPDRALARAYLAEYARVARATDLGSATQKRLRDGMTSGFFAEVKARLNAALARAGAPEPYRVQRHPQPDRPAEFALNLPPKAISIEEEA